MNWPQWINVNSIKFLIFGLIVSASVISWIIRKVKEQRDLRRAEMERQQRFEEALRTGRTVLQAGAPSPQLTRGATMAQTADEPRERLREMARRRQAEIAARRTGVPGPIAPPTASPPSGRRPPIVVMGPNGPILIQPRNGPKTPPAPAPQAPPIRAPQGPRASRSQRREDRRRSPEPAPAPAPAAPPSKRSPSDFPQAADANFASTEALRRATKAAFALKTKGAPAMARLFGNADPVGDDIRRNVRRGILIAEVLAKPVALRPPESE
ncbi:MAG: hypothetical protein KF745_06665 [Phycisphaeraceae bacterium]|nr:hypothetical protein [Phycisphaeraceae bacterium]